MGDSPIKHATWHVYICRVFYISDELMIPLPAKFTRHLGYRFW